MHVYTESLQGLNILKECTDCLLAVNSTLTLWYFHRSPGGCTKPVKPRGPRWLSGSCQHSADADFLWVVLRFRFSLRQVSFLPKLLTTPVSGPSQLSGLLQLKTTLCRISLLYIPGPHLWAKLPEIWQLTELKVSDWMGLRGRHHQLLTWHPSWKTASAWH